MNRYLKSLVVALCGVTFSAQGSAANSDEQAWFSEENHAWTWQITPYVWAAGMKGDISPFKHAPTMSVKKSFSDVMSDFSMGGFINAWGRYDRFVFSGDMMYISTRSTDASGPLSAFQLPGLGVTIPPGASTRAKVKNKQFMATVQGGYRVVSTPDFTLDALAGIRFWHISTDVSVTAGHPAIGTVSASQRERFGWVDPLLGVRAFVPLTDHLSLQVQADVGGFGVGSKMTWSTLGTVNYVFSDRFSVSAGYKVLDVDYKHSGHVYDVRMKGPVLGLTYRF
ncbi:MAG: hypothetical protein ACTJHW_14785 [Paenalcaligenes sp.]